MLARPGEIGQHRVVSERDVQSFDVQRWWVEPCHGRASYQGASAFFENHAATSRLGRPAMTIIMAA